METQQVHISGEALHPGFRARPATLGDLDATVQAIEANFQHITGRQVELLDDIRRWWQEPGFDMATDLQVVLTPQGGIAGYCEVSDVLEPPVKMNLWLQVHPDYGDDGAGKQLLTWAELRSRQALEKTSEGLRIVMQSHVPVVDESTRKAFEDSGFRSIRYALTMVLQMEQEPQVPEWPAGIHVRGMQRNKDEVNILRVVRDSLKDHWGYMDTPFEEEKERWLHNIEADAEFDPSLWFLAMDGEELVGVLVMPMESL